MTDRPTPADLDAWEAACEPFPSAGSMMAANLRTALAFAITARTALPRLIAAVRELEAELEQVRAAERSFRQEATQAWRRADDALGVATADNAELRKLLAELIDHEPCRYDHHGYCQAHGLSAQPCRMQRARAALATREVKDE